MPEMFSSVRRSMLHRHGPSVCVVKPYSHSLRQQYRYNFSHGIVKASSTSNAAEVASGQPSPRDDDVLPDDLMDSLHQAASATNEAMAAGVCRAAVEVLLPEFWDPMSGAVFSEEGDQMRFWKLNRRFADNLISLLGCENVTVVFPDIGVSSYLMNTWTDATFRFGSLRDRKPLTGAEDLVIFAAPDPQGASACIQLAKSMPANTPLVLFNARLVSGDVGVGLNVRRIRSEFLSQYMTTYSIRPIGDIGTIYRRYPDMWRVFVQDDAYPGRYKLVAERPERPAGDALDAILQDVLGTSMSEDGQVEPGIFSNLSSTISSVQRFMRQLSN